MSMFYGYYHLTLRVFGDSFTQAGDEKIKSLYPIIDTV